MADVSTGSMDPAQLDQPPMIPAQGDNYDGLNTAGMNIIAKGAGQPQSNHQQKPPDASMIMNALTDKSKQYQALTGQESAEMAPTLNRLNNTINEPMPKTPDLRAELMKAPQIQDYGKLLQGIKQSSQDWMGTAGILSGLVGAFSRKHTTLAIKAFSSAVKGFQQGQTDAVKEQLDIFKQASNQAVENAKALNDQYLNVLKQRELSVTEMQDQLKDIALKYQDPLMAQKLDAMDFLAIQKELDSREKTANTMQGQNEKLANQVNEIPYVSKDAFITGARAQGGIMSQAANQADAVLKGKEPFPASTTRNPQNLAALNLVNKAIENGYPYSAATYPAYAASIKKLQESKVPKNIGDTEQNISKVNNHLQTLQNSMDQLNSGDSRTVNAAVQKLQLEFNDPNIVSAQTAAIAVSNEFNKVFVPTGGVEDERKAQLSNISPNSGPDQIKAAVKTMKELMDGQAKGIYLIDHTIQQGGDVATLNVPASYITYVSGLPDKGTSEPSDHSLEDLEAEKARRSGVQ